MNNKTKKRAYRKYEGFVVIVTIASFLICLIAECENGYELMCIIPLLYLFAFLFNKNIHKYSPNNIGLFMLNVLMLIKYSIVPLIIALNKDFNTPHYYTVEVSPTSNLIAILLLAIELIIVNLVVAIFSNKFYGQKKNTKNSNKIEKIKTSPFLILAIIFLSTVLLLNINQAIPKDILLINGSFRGNNLDNNGLSLIISLAKLVLTGLIINHLIIKFKDSNKNIYVYLAYLTILVYCLLNTSTARRSMILPLILFVLITYDIFKRKGRALLFGSIILLTISISAITIYKSSWLYSENDSLINVLKTSSLGIQEYTSNIRPTAIGIEMAQKYREDITIETFFNDFLGSVPLLSSKINQNNRINYYYNNYILNGKNTSQIVPMSIIGYTYFSIFFSWLPIAICIYLLMYFEYKYNKKTRTTYLEQYLSLYLFFIFVASLDSNTQMIFARILNTYIPAYAIIKINELLCQKRIN